MLDDDYVTLPSRLINQHKELTRIYDTGAQDYSSFALRFRLDSSRQYLIINDQQPVALRNAHPDQRFSGPISIVVPVGDPAPGSTASAASILPFPFPFPPWFRPADATLLAWHLAPRAAAVRLRASWSAATDPDGFGGPMEIWPDGESWYGRSGGDGDARSPATTSSSARRR
ncbi:hypothetical protein SLS58_009385 [Diplodia intermedia]|uniref:Uncharacterized protein n=1 Tax=Diplodia intermedia TaxID=856260 RepID=A0ABR3TCN5_9PEZI